MKELILKHLEKHHGFITKEKLQHKLEIKGEEQTTSFLQALDTMVEDGSLFFDAKKGYQLFTNELGVAFGEIEINKAGNGYVHTKDGYTIFIENEDLNGALNNDNVIVGSILPKDHGIYKGKVEKIVKRNNGHLICEAITLGTSVDLVPYNKNEHIKIHVNKNELRNLVEGELVLVNVSAHKKNNEFEAEIDKVIGHKNDAGIDLKLIYEEYEIPIEFSEEALDEANKLPVEVTEPELEGRVDLRDKNIITIDCDGTKDRDDAVYVEVLENGNLKLYTSISHVSYYVPKNSSLYKEASTRSTSHYPNNTCNPMFPPKLSNGICSLNEGVDRLTRTCEMEFDPQGNIVDYQIYTSVINSKKAMKYSEVNQVLEGNIVPGYEPFIKQLKLMEKLCDLLEQKRYERNYIDFDIPDIEIIHNEEGKAHKFIESPTGKAQKIIENFMLITGTTVAEHYSWFPFIYRVHEAPNQETVNNVIKTLRSVGFKIPEYKNINEAALKNIIEKVGTSEEAKLIREMLLKSMKRARYDVNNIGHFALQLKNYCHFTSPIRRFTDFRIHTLLDELETLDYTDVQVTAIEQELISTSNYASNMERRAKEVEQEALKMSMAEYMENHIGESYDALVTEVYSSGLFVKTNEMISGKVKLDNIDGDKYYYDANAKAVVGKNHNKKYQIGDKVYVIAKDASKIKRTIDFEIKGKVKTLNKV